jgi:hypothetical protein
MIIAQANTVRVTFSTSNSIISLSVILYHAQLFGLFVRVLVFVDSFESFAILLPVAQ